MRNNLAETDRRKLESIVRNRLRREADRPEPEAAKAGAAEAKTKAPSFESLPGLLEQRALRAAASAMGLRDPYFLVHDGDGGPRTIISGRQLVNFSSYDYLGLNHHPAVRAAAHEAIDRYGISTSASRLVAGERPIHRELEAALANHYQTEACVSFVSGHATNVSTISALLGPRDLVIHDALAHNSIVLGAQLSSAARRSYPHNDMAALDLMLQTCRAQYERILIVAEGLYSMDGDMCPLPELVEIKDRHGAWLMIDDAHGLGVLGPRGFGVFEHFGVDPSRVDIWMGTLSKTLAACGGYIAGAAALVDYLKYASGGFVYSVGMPAPVAAAALAALAKLHEEPERVLALRRNSRQFLSACRSGGLDTGACAGEAIIPVMTDDSILAVKLSERLFTRAINVQPIIAPAVPDRQARLRFFLTADHSSEEILTTVDVLCEELAKLRGASRNRVGRVDDRP